MLRGVLLVLIALVVGLATSRSLAAEPSTAEVADQAAELFDADAESLSELAEAKTPDPWNVIDELLLRDRAEVATALARAYAEAQPVDAARLPEFVMSRVDAAVRRDVRAQLRALPEGESPDAALSRLASLDASGDPMAEWLRLTAIARAHDAKRDAKNALPSYLAIADHAKALGWLRAEADALFVANIRAFGASTPADGLELLQRVRELADRRSDELTLAHLLGAEAGWSERTRNLTRARELHRRSGVALEKLGALLEAGQAFQSAGLAARRAGDLPNAVRLMERGVVLIERGGSKAALAGAQVNLGVQYGARWEWARAVQWYERAIENAIEAGARRWEAAARINRGMALWSLGRREEMETALVEGLAIAREVGDQEYIAVAMKGLADLAHHRKEFDKEIEILESLLETRPGHLPLIGRLAWAHQYTGAPEKALELLDPVLDALTRPEDRRARTGLLQVAGGSAHRLGRHERAIRLLREVLEIRAESLEGLSDQHLTVNLSQPSVIPRMQGLNSAVAIEDHDAALYFSETIRAGALVQALGGRAAVRDQVVPEEQRRTEDALRRAESDALKQLRAARQAGKLKAIRDGSKAVEGARARLVAHLSRIQEDLRHKADLVRPVVPTLAELQELLEPDQAMVLYTLDALWGVEASLALVITKDDFRAVDLPHKSYLERQIGPALLDEPPYIEPEHLGKARNLVVRKLALPKSIRRVWVATDGPISLLPAGLLFPEREVVQIPSATAFRLLRQNAPPPGSEVLAIADPDYETGANAANANRAAAGLAKLARLPATATEARAVGDVVLLQDDATESKVREALRGRKRWRSVHLACHGLVDPLRPQLCSLALTADDEDDGLWTAMDIFDLDIPADLVVLSACETGKGRVQPGEGVVGLTRAFFAAGAKSVLVSLWKVDDEATSALMIRFYELWNPKPGDGVKPLSAPAALRQAQEYIRSQEQWSHPQYWAAWSLWNVPE